MYFSWKRAHDKLFGMLILENVVKKTNKLEIIMLQRQKWRSSK